LELEQAQKRVEELRAVIEKNNRLYYDQDAPELEDFEYDALTRELKELEAQNLSTEEQMKIIDFAIQTIYADNKIEYSEVKFFKKIRSRLSLTDEQILVKYPDLEDFLLPDINIVEDPEWNNAIFKDINFTEYRERQ
jgi:NAD-dependent DNA ligase